MNRTAALAKELASSFVAWVSAHKGPRPAGPPWEMLGKWLHAVYPNLAEERATAICREATLENVVQKAEEFAVDFKALAKSLLRLPKGTLEKN